MYINLALANGVLLAVMIFLNGMLSGIIGPYMSTFVFHTLGLALALFISAVNKNKLPNVKRLPVRFMLPGVLNVVTILLNNICIPHIGITLTLGISLYGQLVMSSAVDHFGLFGVPANRFRKEKIPGFSLISLGILVMIVL